MPYTNNLPDQEREHPLLSEEMQEIIRYQPHWFIRRGNVLFFCILLALLSVSWFIKYPDTITTSVRLTAVNAPKMLVPKAAGKLEKLFIKNGEQVKTGQHLALVENAADYQEVMNLYKWITTAENNAGDSNLYRMPPLPVFTSLGSIQQTYQDFLLEMKETKETLAGGYYQKKISALQKDLHYLSSLKTDAAGQQELVVKDQELQKKELEAYEKLAAEKVIAPMELNQYKSRLLAKDQALKQVHAQITNTELSGLSKTKEILELRKAMADQQHRFTAALHILKEKTEEWIQQYVIVAPEPGRLEYTAFLQENQLVEAGEALFFVQQQQAGYYAELKAGQAGFGKIKTGQKVIIKLEGYPEAEFGHVEGRVSYISGLPDGRDSFLIKAELPRGLTTNYNRQIGFQNSLAASGQVITDNRRLSDRFFSRLRQLFN